MEAEQISGTSQQIMHLLDDVNDELWHATSLHGDNTVDPDLIADAKQSLHRLVQGRARRLEAYRPKQRIAATSVTNQCSRRRSVIESGRKNSRKGACSPEQSDDTGSLGNGCQSLVPCPFAS